MQLFESYHFISRAVVALVLLAFLIFYIISLRLTVKRQVRIIKSLRQQLQNLLDPSASVEAVRTDHLFSEVQGKNLGDEALETLSTEQELFVKATLYMKEKTPFTNPDFRIDDLAKALCSNRTTLANCIRKYTFGDMTLLQFINRYRLNYAVQLLSSPDNKLHISQIAEAAGFRSRSVFNRQFFLRFHCSPSEFRENPLNQAEGEMLLTWQIHLKNRPVKRIQPCKLRQ